MSNVIAKDQTTVAVITMVKNQIRNERKVYANYIAAHGVTTDTVAEHVKNLREQAYPGVKPASRAVAGTPEANAHRFACKIRNGLNHNLNAEPTPGSASEKFVTALGLKADDREAFIKQCLAEFDAAHKG